METETDSLFVRLAPNFSKPITCTLFESRGIFWVVFMSMLLDLSRLPKNTSGGVTDPPS